MIECIHDFQLLYRYHTIIEEIREDPHSRILLVSKSGKAGKKPEKAVGIFPSSFNPITHGHMAILRGAAKIKAFQEILLVLDTQAMDKEILGATLVDRLLMLLVLFEHHPQFSVGVSNRGLFLAKAEVVKEMYPKDMDIIFIVGYDTLARVLDPKYYEDREGALDRLFAACTFMVANRGDYGRKAIKRLMASRDNRRFRGKVQFFEIPHHLATISSNRVRQRVRERKPFAQLIPAQVKECIEKVQLYMADREVGSHGPRVNLYDLRTQILCRLYALYPEGKAQVDIGEIVEKMVERVKVGQRLEALLECLPQYTQGGEGKG